MRDEASEEVSEELESTLEELEQVLNKNAKLRKKIEEQQDKIQRIKKICEDNRHKSFIYDGIISIINKEVE